MYDNLVCSYVINMNSTSHLRLKVDYLLASHIAVSGFIVNDDDDDFATFCKHFTHRLVGCPRWEEFDSFTARCHS